MCVLKLSFTLLLFTMTVQLTSCKCRKSFMTECDSFEDLPNNKQSETWTELIIGSEHSSANESVNLMKTLDFRKYPKLTAFYVIKKINNLESTYGYKCDYYPINLNLVVFYGNIFKTVEEYHFPGVEVRKFSLTNNKIEAIKGGTFDNLETEIFDLSDNLLEVIEADSLPKTKKTKSISVKNNRLNSIEPGSFASTLLGLHLDYNNLRHLTDEVIGVLTDLQELTLSNNKLEDVPNVAHMEDLVFLVVSFNAITFIKSAIFEELNNLKLLDLSNNKITDFNLFSYLIGPKKQTTLKISLAFNRLRELNLTDVSFKQETLLLYGNPWDCQAWDQMQKKLIHRQDKCDLKFFSSGSMPYCLNYKSEVMIFDYNWEQHIDRFHNTVKTSTTKINCDLTLEKYDIFDVVEFECVA